MLFRSKTETKEAVNSFLDNVLTEDKQFKNLMKEYISATENVSKLYGNSPLEFQKQAKEEIYKKLGNQLLVGIKAAGTIPYYRALIAPKRQVIMESIKNTLLKDSAIKEKYDQLLKLIPKELTPLREVLKGDKIQGQLRDLVKDLVNSNQEQIKLYMDNKMYFAKNIEDIGDVLVGEHLDKDDIYSKGYKDIYSFATKLVIECLFNDKEYQSQWINHHLENTLLAMFELLGQNKNHQLNISKYGKRDTEKLLGRSEERRVGKEC